MLEIRQLETERLVVRRYHLNDLASRFRLMQVAFASTDTLEDTERWLRWAVVNYEQLALLYQPPYGDYAVELKETGEVIGSVGLVPVIIPWGVFEASEDPQLHVAPEFGLFWAVLPDFQQRGYATEAVRAMVDYVFLHLNGRRVVAQTENTNLGSMSVMQKLGMEIMRNPHNKPVWLETLGVLAHPDLRE